MKAKDRELEEMCADIEEIKLEKKSGSLSSLFKGFLVGGMIGAGVALLAAPRSGMETRDMLKDKSVELREKAIDKVNQANDTANDLKSRSQSKITDQKNSVQAVVEGVKEGVRTYKEQSQTDQPDPLAQVSPMDTGTYLNSSSGTNEEMGI